ncbi:hypothetical protein BaRGS_00008850 [Batillaria attramentaria]|uniref:BZIP domain-containing protein n=1 Tax=Batillaria attramentaria TaxID=370345 RepID=A0ABD0LL02_9CAEN
MDSLKETCTARALSNASLVPDFNTTCPATLAFDFGSKPPCAGEELSSSPLLLSDLQELFSAVDTPPDAERVAMDTDRHDSAHTQLQETMFFDQDSYARGFVDALQLVSTDKVVNNPPEVHQNDAAKLITDPASPDTTFTDLSGCRPPNWIAQPVAPQPTFTDISMSVPRHRPGLPTSDRTNGVPSSVLTNGNPSSVLTNGNPSSVLSNGIPSSVLSNGIPSSVLSNGIPNSVLPNGVPSSVQTKGGLTSVHTTGGVLPPIDVLTKPVAVSVNGSGLPHYPPSFSFFSHDDQDCSFEYGQSQAMDSDSDDDTNSNLSMSSSASSSRRSRRTPVSEEDRQEEKRKRNRDAAARCRAKKLDNIATLSDRVKDLKEENCHLVNTVTALRDDVAKIKQQILEHATDGCLKLAPNELSADKLAPGGMLVELSADSKLAHGGMLVELSAD